MTGGIRAVACMRFVRLDLPNTMPNSTYDDDSTICPYCEHPHHQEAEDFNDREHEETCEECGETFLAYDEATVTHYARKKPNDQTHTQEGRRET